MRYLSALLSSGYQDSTFFMLFRDEREESDEGDEGKESLNSTDDDSDELLD